MIPDHVWDQVAPFLEPALADGWTLEQVRREVDAGMAQLWIGNGAASVTEAQTNRDFHFWLAGGSLDELLNMHASAEEHARAWDCERMTLRGRDGWIKPLKALGYQVMLVKDL